MPSKNAFPVDVDVSSATIGEFKELIMPKITDTFKGDAKDLTLWCASISNLDKLPPEATLDARATLGSVYPQGQGPHDYIILRQQENRSYLRPFLMEPGPLLRTMGLDWTYQPDPKLYETLRVAIKDHYRDFFQGLRDKSTIPLYLFLCGAGTGKSRNAQELHRSAVSCLTDKDHELRSRIEQAWVFHISLENGTSPLGMEKDPMEAIGSRMLLQLLPDMRLRDVMEAYIGLHPMHVLDLVARGAGRDLRSATVFLVIDGLQSFMTDPNDGSNKNSDFYNALTNIADLATEDVFLLACCTATVTSPVDRALAFTHRKRVVLPVASLESPCIFQDGLSVPVFEEDDHIIKVLVSDCGGHGRALECLQQALNDAGSDYDVDSLMNQLHTRIRDLYSEAIAIPPSTAEAIGRAILTRTRLNPEIVLPGTNKTPGELAIPGLVRYEQPDGLGSGGYLMAPYIWIWFLSYQPNERADPLLKNWGFSDYSEIKSKVDPRSPPGAQFWQHFEHFVATFRCIKSRVLEDSERTSISAIHTGARLNGDIQFTNRHLALEVSMNQVDTKSTAYDFSGPLVQCSQGKVRVSDGTHCIINAPSAPFGDSFLGLSAKSFCTEVHQCKLITSSSDRIDFHAEIGKAASPNDFFILFTAQKRLM
ncbi:MAG: hypothetical protein J3Q66DRAFT_404319 [Benniella sp.]|nr:MAG: hypothetical protein J3Q66DRAFT_404319 [Benniella sp.]